MNPVTPLSFPLGRTSAWRVLCPELLHLVASEEIVLLAARAFRALQAADQQHRHAYRYQDGKEIRIRRKPVGYAVHKQRHILNSKTTP